MFFLDFAVNFGCVAGASICAVLLVNGVGDSTETEEGFGAACSARSDMRSETLKIVLFAVSLSSPTEIRCMIAAALLCILLGAILGVATRPLFVLMQTK